MAIQNDEIFGTIDGVQFTMSACEQFVRIYGQPTNIDKVWEDRDREQNNRNYKRYIFRQLETAMFFGEHHPGGVTYHEDMKASEQSFFDSVGISRDKL